MAAVSVPNMLTASLAMLGVGACPIKLLDSFADLPTWVAACSYSLSTTSWKLELLKHPVVNMDGLIVLG
ncbi:hypothetical protein ACH5RR_028409 [Cinchona calisaya]|uniref:Uncharacterized protein n=1 Tax=Cinchona calisaya TaxID=153742 RepID=A0ABD2YNR0_9GENT